MGMRGRTRQRYHHRLDPALRSAIARAAGAYGGRIGGPARAARMTPLERSIAAMRAVKARWAKTPAEERRAWSDYLRAHQRRFWDGRLPRKPVRARVADPVEAFPVVVPPTVTAPARREPVPPPIPVVVMPRRSPPEAGAAARVAIRRVTPEYPKPDTLSRRLLTAALSHPS